MKSVGAMVLEIYMFWNIHPNMANVPRYRSMSEYFPYHQCVLLFIPHIVEKFSKDRTKYVGATVIGVHFLGFRTKSGKCTKV